MKVWRDWQDHAACANSDVEMIPDTPGHNFEAQLRVCDTCTVVAECLADVLWHERGSKWLRFGVRGGTTPAQRQEMTERRRERLAARVEASRRLRHEPRRQTA